MRREFGFWKSHMHVTGWFVAASMGPERGILNPTVSVGSWREDSGIVDTEEMCQS